MRGISGAIAAIAVLTLSPAFAQQAAPVIDSMSVLTGPPAENSPGRAADHLATRPVVSAERLQRATADREFSPWAALSPVMGEGFNAAHFPRTGRVYQTLLAGLGPAIGQGKDRWAVRRPFWSDEAALQCGAADAGLRADASPPNYSYPSGHATAGWAWALVTAELLPERATAILVRGREYGESRVICGFHFPSDIEAGRTLAAGVVARLHADAAFRRELDAARRELQRAYPSVH